MNILHKLAKLAAWGFALFVAYVTLATMVALW